MRTRTIALLASLALAAPLGAQGPDGAARREIRPFVGAFVPSGAMRDVLADAPTVGVQLALEESRHFHYVAAVAWTRGRQKLGASTDVTHIWHYDVGAEVNALAPLGSGWTARPFVGAGAGGRTYDYRAAELQTRVCAVGYGALGAELERGAVALRTEARGYRACYTATARRRSGADLGLSLGLAYHLR